MEILDMIVQGKLSPYEAGLENISAKYGTDQLNPDCFKHGQIIRVKRKLERILRNPNKIKDEIDCNAIVLNEGQWFGIFKI